MPAAVRKKVQRVSTSLPKERPQNANLNPGNNPGVGRPPGALGLRTKVMKDALIEAATRAGDILYARELTRVEKDKDYKQMLQGSGLADYLTHIALTKEELFMAALTKVMPLQVVTNAPVVSLNTFVDSMGEDEVNAAYSDAIRDVTPFVIANDEDE